MGKNNASDTNNSRSIRILMIEDSENDVLLIIRELKKGGYDVFYERIETAVAMKKALKEKSWDIIICDYKMPRFNAPAAIAILKESAVDIPMIIVSGTIGEETAVQCMRLGAHDYIMKTNFFRLCPVVAREIEEAKIRNNKKLAESQRETALEALRHSEEKHRAILENIEDGYYEVDLAGNLVFCNAAMSRILGYQYEDLLGINSRQLTDKENARKLFNTFHDVFRTGKPAKGFDWQVIRKDGTKRYIEASVSLLKDSANRNKGFRGIVRDITERKQTEESLRKSEELYTRLVNAIPDVIVQSSLEGEIIFVNDNTLKIGGYSREEIEGQPLLKFIASEDHDEAIKNIILSMDSKLGPREYKIVTKDGRKIPFEVNGDILRNRDGTPFGIVHVGRDISERKHTEEILREKEDRLKGITNNLPGVIFQFHAKETGEYEISYVSERQTDFLGTMAHTDTAGNNGMFSLFLSHIHEEDKERLLSSVKTAIETTNRWNFEGRFLVPTTRKLIWIQGLATPTKHDKLTVFDGILLDITERKKAEEKSRQSEEKFYKIFMTTPDCVAISRLHDGLIIDVNKGYEDIVGWKRENVIGTTTVEPPQNFWVDPSARDVMVADLKSGLEIMDRQFEFRRSDGSVRDGIYSARSINIDNEECIIFILRDITDHLRMDVELRRTLESLRKAVGTTINVMVSAVEMRDPYTAGHQSRVADLARAIATDIGLPQNTIDGIRMAGTIHDIGKLSIPAEILTKPTKLTNIEYSLVKEHSQSGYEMLKDIESPWPLAEIVYQHHERIDGSGYPRNLKSTEILIEARILAVADVVEAMASHRPYRASLGIESALQEIENNKGVLYDGAVVDVCLTLFRDKGYNLPPT